MDITVIVPSYKSEETISACLQSLLDQDTKASYETIVVDSTPGEGVKNIVSKFSGVKFIKLNQKTYSGTARNIGAEQARGELILLIDSDVFASRSLISSAIKCYKEGHDIFSASLEMWPENRLNISGKIQWFYGFNEFYPRSPKGQRWCLPSAALGVKKQLLDKNKFLDLQTSTDTEFTVRLRKKGYNLYFDPDIKASHIFHLSFYGVFKKIYYFGIGNAKIRKIHNVSGSKITNTRVAAFFAIPFFAIIKLVKISWRNIRYNGLLDILLYIIFFPLISLLILFWMFGFYKGCFSRDS